MLKQKTDWEKLTDLIRKYGDARAADEMKGSADPMSMGEIEANLLRTRLALAEHITAMQKTYKRV